MKDQGQRVREMGSEWVCRERKERKRKRKNKESREEVKQMKGYRLLNSHFSLLFP